MMITILIDKQSILDNHHEYSYPLISSPTESVRPAQIEIPNHHANTQLQPMTPESWRELSNWDKGRIEGWRRSM